MTRSSSDFRTADILLFKLLHVYLPVLGIVLLFPVLYSYFYWVLVVRMQLVPVAEEVADWFVPAACALVVVLLAVRPRVRRLKTARGFLALKVFYGYPLVFMVALTIQTQQYVRAATGTLVQCRELRACADAGQTTIALQHWYADTAAAGVERTDFTLTGTTTRFSAAIAIPLYDDTTNAAQHRVPAWLGLNFSEQVDTRRAEEVVQREVEQYYRLWLDSAQRLAAGRFRYLTAVGSTGERGNLERAAQRTGLVRRGERLHIYRPVFIAFEARTARAVDNVLIGSCLGAAFWTLLVLIARVDRGSMAMFVAGREADEE